MHGLQTVLPHDSGTVKVQLETLQELNITKHLSAGEPGNGTVSNGSCTSF